MKIDPYQSDEVDEESPVIPSNDIDELQKHFGDYSPLVIDN